MPDHSTFENCGRGRTYVIIVMANENIEIANWECSLERKSIIFSGIRCSMDIGILMF